MLIVSDFLIVITSIIGLYLFRKINKEYIPFIWYILAIAITELSSYANFNSNIKQAIVLAYVTSAYQLLLTIFFSWDKYKVKLKTKVFIRVFLFFLVLADVILFFFYGVTAKWGTLLTLSILSIYSISILIQHGVGFYSMRSTISRALIIVPFVVFNIYFIPFKIMLYFLYNASNEIFFLNLFSLIHMINILSYICFSLSLIIAPRRERYLNAV